MTLSEWAAQHRDEIIAEDASRAAVAPLMAVVAREITDAEGVPDGEMEVLGEGRTVTVKDGSFRDEYTSLGVHIYRARKAG